MTCIELHFIFFISFLWIHSQICRVPWLHNPTIVSVYESYNSECQHCSYNKKFTSLWCLGTNLPHSAGIQDIFLTTVLNWGEWLSSLQHLQLKRTVFVSSGQFAESMAESFWIQDEGKYSHQFCPPWSCIGHATCRELISLTQFENELIVNVDNSGLISG
jgi:hypothetical protein